MKSAETQKTGPPPQDSFKPFDYSQSDLKVFAGMAIVLFFSSQIRSFFTFSYSYAV